MSSVTQRIKEIKQPKGGYLKPSEFEYIQLNDKNELNLEENIHPSVVGMVVDYMTRFIMGAKQQDAFSISIMGAIAAEKLGKKGSLKEISSYLSKVDGLNDESIINACKAVTFDVWFRNPIAAINSKNAEDTNPDKNTIENIIIMINRSVDFWNQYGPITSDGFTFEGGGYTDIVDSGDGDFLTESTLWDYKVSKNKLKGDQTLQLLMYYIMGKHSGKTEFKGINKLGIFNPRLNVVYLKNIDDISDDVINEVSSEVIGYKTKQSDKTISLYEKYKEEDDSNNDYIDMNEIMRLLGCSRYRVMNMYSTQGLPLVKIKNRYYIKMSDLLAWIEEQRIKQRRAIIQSIVFTILAFVLFFIMYYFLIRRH